MEGAGGELRRTVNIDPGLLSEESLVLATTKASGHRVAIATGLWAEVTLRFERGEYRPLPWTYPDYRKAGGGGVPAGGAVPAAGAAPGERRVPLRVGRHEDQDHEAAAAGVHHAVVLARRAEHRPSRRPCSRDSPPTVKVPRPSRTQ